MQESLWIAAGALLVLAVIAGFADRRRQKRTDFDAVGILPWPFIQLMALLAALVCASLALHA